MNLLQRLEQITGQAAVEVWYESELAARVGTGVRELRQFLDARCEPMDLPALAGGRFEASGGQVFLLVSEFRGGFWIRALRLR